jgi:hypothetical protein
VDITIASVSATISQSELEAAIGAIGVQISRDVGPEWNVSASLSVKMLDLSGSQVALNSPSDAIIYIGDKSQDPTTGLSNLYGYHSTNHIPYAFVYADVCALGGEKWSCTLSHEVLELLVDPAPTPQQYICGPDPRDGAAPGSVVYYAKEICDPTQGDTYLIDGVTVSNFVMKAYFSIPGGAQRTNYLNLVLGSFGVRPGGYCQYEDGTDTGQVNGHAVTARRIEARRIIGAYRRNAKRTARLIAPGLSA